VSARFLVLALALACAALAHADRLVPARDLKFEQRLDQIVPLDATLTGEEGQPVTLRDAIAGKPTVLALVYFKCPRVCGLVLEGLTRSLRNLKELDAGKDYQVVCISFDPKDTAKFAFVAKQRTVKMYAREPGWKGFRFLVGAEEQVRRIADAIGFSYKWDEGSKQWAHPTGVVVMTPEGRTARYFYGIDYEPKDLKLALVEASAGKIGSLVDQVLLFCYGFDESTGKYTLVVMRVMRAAGMVTLALVIGLLVVLRRREHARMRGIS
jgi:protein SCO1/2